VTPAVDAAIVVFVAASARSATGIPPPAATVEPSEGWPARKVRATWRGRPTTGARPATGPSGRGR
jgi:hypothetical protein